MGLGVLSGELIGLIKRRQPRLRRNSRDRRALCQRLEEEEEERKVLHGPEP